MLNSVERWRENTSKESCERAAKGDAERERERERERESKVLPPLREIISVCESKESNEILFNR